MKKNYRIAVIPGDGIGPEVVEVGLAVLNRAMELVGRGNLDITTFPWGSEYYLQQGVMMPAGALEALNAYDAILLGAVGDPRVPDHVSLDLLLDIRKGFDQYVNLRPVKLLDGVETPVKRRPNVPINFIVVRENTEGEYSRVGGRFKKGTPGEVALQTAVFTRRGTERVIRYAFELALERSTGNACGPRPLVTNCTKSNALNYSMVFWDEVFDEVALGFPGVNTDKALVDALTMWLVRKPEYFDVIVASNLFGDIITDLGAALQGGMGLAAGGNINPPRLYPSMFEPIHGSAPRYKGQNKSNPMATIWAGAMMLDFIGAKVEADITMKAMEAVLRAGQVRTYDLGGDSSTTRVGEAVIRALPCQ